MISHDDLVKVAAKIKQIVQKNRIIDARMGYSGRTSFADDICVEIDQLVESERYATN